ncbi:hypothetical protein CDAR_290331 [Caerostris darwini]|uniref:Uncharacterized protein n=1 Tax=Caerostris darwini TaxID=1538125 RepID=A0AAV4T9V0_9ARAC|nr:hypothetical protein CDAR_290331 [Caerostris darwini]
MPVGVLENCEVQGQIPFANPVIQTPETGRPLPFKGRYVPAVSTEAGVAISLKCDWQEQKFSLRISDFGKPRIVAL